ncbi:hypothetical protein B0J14DRAFT_578528 [Halenospora varia]|nr:hypothetical protein B0J14DRAFT_578528 [Halenospora varia]
MVDFAQQPQSQPYLQVQSHNLLLPLRLIPIHNHPALSNSQSSSFQYRYLSSFSLLSSSSQYHAITSTSKSTTTATTTMPRAYRSYALPARRSPRTIYRFTFGTAFPHYTLHQTGVLVSMCFSTGWSADRIALRLEDIYLGTTIEPEELYDFFAAWVEKRSGTRALQGLDPGAFPVDQDWEWDCMNWLMGLAGVRIAEWGRPLNQSERPRTVKFQPQWSPKSSADEALCPGFTPAAREATKQYLSSREQMAFFPVPTPLEEPVLVLFAPTLSELMKMTLAQWATDMLTRLAPGLRPIKEKEQVDRIMDHLKDFQKDYERAYGRIEETRGGILGEIKDNTVYIRSTGYGAKVLLGLLMADRLHVIDRQRRKGREAIGFEVKVVAELDKDSRNCLICGDEFGVESEEKPLQLVICCNKIFGDACLRIWLEGYDGKTNQNCPHCRHRFPASFIDRLMPVQEDVDVDEDGDAEMAGLVGREIIDLVSSSQSPRLEPLIRLASPDLLDVQEGEDLIDLSDDLLDQDDMMMEG